LRSEKIAQLFGDFRDKGANATVADKAIGVVGRLFPFASWGLRYAPTLATIAARHPRATQGLVGYLASEAQQAKAEGRYLRAIRELAQVRTIQRVTVQVNVGEQQIIIGG